jgi:hypothetical protein
LPDRASGHAADERVTGNAFGHHGAARDDARLPDGHSGKYRASRRKPRAIFDDDRPPDIGTGAKVRRTDFVVGGDKDSVVANTDAIAYPYFGGKVKKQRCVDDAVATDAQSFMNRTGTRYREPSEHQGPWADLETGQTIDRRAETAKTQSGQRADQQVRQNEPRMEIYELFDDCAHDIDAF